jgi:hypothetical protein
MRIKHNPHYDVEAPPCPYCEKRILLACYYGKNSVDIRCRGHLRHACTPEGRENRYSFMRRTRKWIAACVAACVAARPKKVKLAKRKGAAA